MLSSLTERLQKDVEDWVYPVGTETVMLYSSHPVQNWQLVGQFPMVVEHVGGVVEW